MEEISGHATTCMHEVGSWGRNVRAQQLLAIVNEKSKRGHSENRTRDLSHPKRESYH